MKIITLLESTAEDLYRKMDALDAMIGDASTTQGEKDNAASLKKKIQAKLQKNFPNAVRKPTAKKPAGMSQSEHDWYSGMAKAAKKAQEEDDLKQNDPEAYKELMREKLEGMKARLKTMRKYHLSGNVETAYQIQKLSREVESFMRKHFPEEYEELENKRREQSYKAYASREKKKAEKEKAEKDKLKKSGMSTWKVAGKEHESALKKLYDQMEGLKFNAHGYSATLGKHHMSWGSMKGSKFMMRLTDLPMGKVREAWNSLDPAAQQELRDAVSKVNTMGYKNDGYTEAQKKKLLGAMSPYVKPKV